MKTAALSLLAATVGGIAAGWAQPRPGDQLLAPSEIIPYGAPVQVPTNACVWENLVYSHGAVIQIRAPLTTYFRCARGRWEIISPGDLMDGSQPKNAAGRRGSAEP
jgi:hypothetical protein